MKQCPTAASRVACGDYLDVRRLRILYGVLQVQRTLRGYLARRRVTARYTVVSASRRIRTNRLEVVRAFLGSRSEHDDADGDIVEAAVKRPQPKKLTVNSVLVTNRSKRRGCKQKNPAGVDAVAAVTVLAPNNVIVQTPHFQQVDNKTEIESDSEDRPDPDHTSTMSVTTPHLPPDSDAFQRWIAARYLSRYASALDSHGYADVGLITALTQTETERMLDQVFADCSAMERRLLNDEIKLLKLRR